MSAEAERLYERARALPTERRAAFVREACIGDPALRAELMSLLDVADAAESFFGRLGDAVMKGSFLEPGGGDPSWRSRDRLASGLDSPGSSSWLAPGRRVRQYRILEQIGNGGMGTVYRARDTRLGRDVALKFLPPRPSPGDDAGATLLNEARAAAAFVHPNVCIVHEIGESADGRPFIAMAFHEGETLDERLRRGPLPPLEAARVAVQLARGLKAAHAHGIIHRDVKPGNVVLADDGTVKLLDFGLAQMWKAQRSRTGARRGTIPYMSPEQVRGEPVGPRTDLWALGVVLYEMLTGVRPFRAGGEGKLLHAILRREPEPVARLRPDTPDVLIRVVERLLAKRADARFQTATEVEAELTRWIRSTGRKRGQGRPAARRRRITLAGVAVIAVATVAAAVWLPRLGSPASPTAARSAAPRSIGAYELYQRGSDQRVFRSTSALRGAVRDVEQSIALDSTFAPAHARLATLYLILSGHDEGGAPTHVLHARAKQAASTALALDDANAEAHAALGLVHDHLDRDFTAAERELERAIALDPTDARYRVWLAQVQLRMGRTRDALRLVHEALDIDPTSAAAHAELAHALLAIGRYDDALAQLQRIADLEQPLLRAAPYAAQAHAMKGMWSAAIEALRPQAEHDVQAALPLYGYALARAGRRDEARRIRARLLDRWRLGERGAFDVAVLYAGLGDIDQAYHWLDLAADDGSAMFGPLHIMEPIFEELRADPRFEALRVRLGLPAG